MKCIMFQAKVDAEYLHRGLQLVPFFQTHQRMKDEVVKLAVETVYSWNNVSRLAWLVKRGPATSCKWKDLENICAMKSLVLKRDVSEMYKEYAENHKIRFPDLPHMKESLFCEIARHITGGGKKQSAQAGVDYIKVNFHTDNFELVDKVIDMIAPASDSDQMLRSQLLLQRSTVFPSSPIHIRCMCMKELSISMSLWVVANSINVIRSLMKRGTFFNCIKLFQI